MKNGEKPGGSANDEQVLTGYEDGIPPFGGGDIDIVQFEDSDDSIDVPVNESEGSKPEISKEDFIVAQSKLQAAWKRWSNAYFGYDDSAGGHSSHSDAYKIELNRRLGRSGFVDSKLDFISYEDFIAEGHTLEELSEDEKKYTETADAIEAIDMSDFVEPSEEAAGSKPEISKEDFIAAQYKLLAAYKRWSNAYYGYDDSDGDYSHSDAYGIELERRLGRDGFVDSKFDLISYEDFIAEGHTLEEISEDEKKYTEMADAIEAIDMSDFVEPSEEASVDSDAENAEKAKEAAFAELSSACDALIAAALETGLGKKGESGSVNVDALKEKLKELGEDAAFESAISSWNTIKRDRASVTIEDMTKTKAELERLTEVLKGLKADSAGDASKAEDYEKKFEQFASEYKKAVDIFNAVIVWLGYVDSVNDTISSEGLDYLRSIGEYDNYTKMVKQASDFINKKSDPSEWPDMLEELKRITKVLNDGEGGEKAGDKEKKAEAINKLIDTRDTKRINLLLEKIGLDNTHSLVEAEPILNSLNLTELERIQKEIDDELNGEGDKNHEANGENLEYLRSLNFGQWLAVKYDVPGPDSKYFNPNFFAADRKLQQQVMQEYMALFEADANYEKDRAFMVEELCKVEFAKKAMEEMGLDPTNTNMGDLEPMLNKMKVEELNKLYRKVVYGPKPAPKTTAKSTGPKPSSKPTDPKPAEPKPADVDLSEDNTEDDAEDNIEGNPDDSEDDSSDDGESGTDKDIAAMVKSIDKKMPATAEDVKAAFAASPDARRIYGEPDEKMISKTLEEIKVWKKFSDAQKAEFLKTGFMSSGMIIFDLNALVELQKKGILPKRND